jgi:acyl-homoserine lactone acylase PvdQ
VGIGFGGNSGHIMPVEFYAFSIEWEPWTPLDSLAIMRLTSLMMSFSFTVDIVREVFRHIPEIAPFSDELLPFRADFQTEN